MDLRPAQAVTAYDAEGICLIKLHVDDGKLYRKSMTGSTINSTSYKFYTNMIWKRRTINSTKY